MPGVTTDSPDATLLLGIHSNHIFEPRAVSTTVHEIGRPLYVRVCLGQTLGGGSERWERRTVARQYALRGARLSIPRRETRNGRTSWMD